MHPYHLHKLKFTEISEIYTSETIKNFAYSLVSIFIPIYLLKNGLSLKNLCLLYVLVNALRIFFDPLVGCTIARYGAKHILAFSYPFSFLYILLLGIYPSYTSPILVIAAVWAIADSMHWVSYQSAFSKAKHTKKSGSEISKIGILAVVAGAVGPVVGGFAATKYGLHMLFVMASILLLIAMVPLYQSLETVQSQRLKFAGLTKKIKYDMLAHAALSFDVVVGTVIWPLFIYFIVKDYLKLGSIVSFSFIFSILALFIIGKASDVVNKKKLIAVGSLGMAVINVFRSLATNFWYAFGVNFISVILGPLLITPLFSVFYDHADHTRRIEYTVLMEIAGDIARTVLWSILFALTFIVSQRQVFMAAFVCAAAALLCTNIVKLNLKK